MLTNNQRLILYHLVHHPLLSDKELEGKLSIQRTTINSTKNRLEREGYFKPYYLPNFEAVGCELLSIRYADFNPGFSYETRIVKSGGAQFKTQFEEQFFITAINAHRVGICAAKNYTELKKYNDKFDIFYNNLGFYPEHMNTYVHFPFELSEIIKFFDFAPVLKEHFDIKDGADDEEAPFAKGVHADLSENEKRLINALVANPSASTGEIAKLTGLSARTVISGRRRFLEEDILRFVRIPDLAKVGFQYLVFTHTYMDTHYPLEKRKESEFPPIHHVPNIVFAVVGDLEETMISVYKDFAEYEAVNRQILEFYRDNQYLRPTKDVIGKLFPVSDLKAYDFTFHTTLKKVLQTDNDG